MDDLDGMQVNGGLDNFANNEGRNILRESLPPLDVLIEIISVDILSYDIDMGLAADSLLVFYYLRVRNNLHYFTLIVQSCNCLSIQLLSTDVL